jgi:ankyrin repeat protein
MKFSTILILSMLSYASCRVAKHDIGPDEALKMIMPVYQQLVAANIYHKLVLGEAVYNRAKAFKLQKQQEATEAAAFANQRRDDNGFLSPADLDNFKARATEYWQTLLKKDVDYIFRNLQWEHEEVRENVLQMAIAYGNVSFVKDLLDRNTAKKQHFYVSILTYRHAQQLSRQNSTEEADQIVELLFESNPMFRTINSNRASDLIDTGFALIKVLDYIRNNDFPSFKQALNEGLNPNTSIPHFGSFLTLSIMSGCAKCVEALIDRGVDVNASITYSTAILLNGVKKNVNPYGYTPLMYAVADNQPRIITLLIESGKASVTASYGTDENGLPYHARAVARAIPDKVTRKSILSQLILTDDEKTTYASITSGKNFISALNEKKFSLVDAFLLQRPHTNIVPDIVSEKVYKPTSQADELLDGELIRKDAK